MTNRYITKVPPVDFSHAPEMQPFLDDPPAMYVGAPGKKGYLRLGFELDSSGKSILRDLDRRVPIVVQQELYFDEELPGMPCVYILSSGGQYIEGDRYQQDITVRRDAMAFVSTGAGTKIARMKHNYAGMVQNIVLEENAYLEFLPEPTFPCENTRFISDTRMIIHPSATVSYAEIYMGGRKYHNDELFKFDILSVCTHGERPTGEQLFREKFIISPHMERIRDIGIMGDYDVFANVGVCTPPDKAKEIYDDYEPFIDRKNHTAAGITHLPNDAGLLFKVLGKEAGPVKKIVREFCSKVRQAVKGVPIPEEFPWR